MAKEQNRMKIGIIGAGKVGGGLGKLWVRAGHQVLFNSVGTTCGSNIFRYSWRDLK
jgi:3-hydroxyacyl-CoA dehydrogenase